MGSQSHDELAAMQAALAGFQWTTLDHFRLLVDELEMRGSRVQGSDSDWDERFRGQWEALEEVYAVMADRSMSSPDVVLQKVIASAVDNLGLILREKGTR